MQEHARMQLDHFARIDHERRFQWQTEDAFVIEREQETIRPLADAIRDRHAVCGRPIRVLECGCGEGVNLIHLRQMGMSAPEYLFEGVDVSAEAVAEASRHGLTVAVGDGLRLPYPDGSFDVVYTRDVLHHLADETERIRFISEMRRVAAHQGVVVVVEPNPANPMIFLFAWIVRAERGLLTGTESRLRRLLPHAVVARTTPSAAWRAWYHYRSPLRGWAPSVRLTKTVLRGWEAICRRLPSAGWAWRVYRWNLKETD